MSARAEETTEVTHDTAAYRFLVTVDGEDVGYIEYRMGPGVRSFMHTIVDRRFEGRGLATKLVTYALDATRAEGLRVEPYCPFTRGYIKRHPEYLDLVPEDRREDFDLPAGDGSAAS